MNQQFTNHPLLGGYTLGLEVQSFGDRHSVGKGGNIPGFLAFFLLFPEDDLGIFICVNTETDNFLELYFEEFRTQFDLLSVIPRGERLDEPIQDYQGDYENQRTNYSTFEEMFMLFAGHVPIYKSKNDNLLIYHNQDWHEYIMIEDGIFQDKDYTDQYLIFEKDSNGRIQHLYRNVSIGGFQVPASYRPLGWFERPRFINDEYPFTLLVIPSYILLPLLWIIVFFLRRNKPDLLMRSKIHYTYHLAAGIFLILFCWNILGFFLPLLQNRDQLLFEIDPSLLFIRYVNILMVLSAITLLYLSALMWIKRRGSWLIRIYYSFYSLAALSYILILNRWHFLTIDY